MRLSAQCYPRVNRYLMWSRVGSVEEAITPETAQLTARSVLSVTSYIILQEYAEADVPPQVLPCQGHR